jgi:Leucine-rich repeat (LRR) protein
VENLKGLSNLEYLDISSTHVTDAGLAHLRGLKKLQQLGLADCPGISDAGIAHLKGLTRLRVLTLYNDKVTDEGLIQLKGLTELSYLNVHHTQVTDAGVKDLKQSLPELEWWVDAHLTVLESSVWHRRASRRTDRSPRLPVVPRATTD